MTADALRLIQAVGEEGEKWSAGTWTSAAIRRHLTGAVAIGLQRGNAVFNCVVDFWSRTFDSLSQSNAIDSTDSTRLTQIVICL